MHGRFISIYKYSVVLGTRLFRPLVEPRALTPVGAQMNLPLSSGEEWIVLD